MELQHIIRDFLRSSDDGPAIYVVDGQITLKELQTKCTQLQRVLVTHFTHSGVAWAAVCIDRCFAEIVAVFAVVACDHIKLLCLNPALPLRTQQQILAETKPAVLITSNQESSSLLACPSTPTILLDASTGDILQHPTAVSSIGDCIRENLDDVFYMTFTSGSSGNVKGVLNTWRGALNRLQWMWNEFSFEPGEMIARRTPFGFVDCIWEIFGGLLKGVPLYIPSKSAQHDLRQLCEDMAGKVTRITFVPSQVCTMLEIFREDLAELLRAIKVMVVSGEPFTVAAASRLMSVCPHIVLLNLYGSTETAGDITCKVVQQPHPEATETKDPPQKRLKLQNEPPLWDNKYCSCGYVIPGNAVAVWSAPGMPAQPTIEGEVVVSGAHVTRGYWSTAAQSNDRFFQHEGARWFLTGDRGVFTEDGELFITGRMNRLVKVRGVWVDLDYLQSMISNITERPAIAFVCNNHSAILAVLEGVGPVPSPHELNLKLADTFPPEAFVAALAHVNSFPRLFNGKIDLQALPALFDTAAKPAELDTAERVLVQSMQAVDAAATADIAGVLHDQAATLGLLGFDSLKRAELLVELHATHGIELHMMNLEMPIREAIIRIRELLEHRESPPSRIAGTSYGAQVQQNPQASHTASRLPRPGSGAAVEPLGCVVIERCNRVRGAMPSRIQPGCSTSQTQVSASIELKWNQSMTKCIDASACVLVNTATQTAIAVVGSHAHIVAAFNVLTGERLWQTELPDRIEASATCNSSMTGFFVGCYDGRLYLLCASQGTVLYSIQTGDIIKSTAVVDSSLRMVIFASYDRRLYTAAERDGTVLSRLDLDGAVFGALCLREDQRAIYAATTTGTLWAVVYDEQGHLSVHWRVELHCACFSGPTIETEIDSIWVGTVDGKFWVVDFEGIVRRTVQLCESPIFASIALESDPVKSGRVLAFITSHDQAVRCVAVDLEIASVDQHEVVWLAELDSKSSSSCFLHTAGSCILVAATTEGGVYVLDRREGTVLCTKNLPGGVFASPVILPGQFVDAQSSAAGTFHILIGSRDDQFYCFQVQVCLQEERHAT